MIASVVLESEWSQIFFFQSYHKLKAEHVKKKKPGIILLLSLTKPNKLEGNMSTMSTWYAHKDIIVFGRLQNICDIQAHLPQGD